MVAVRVKKNGKLLCVAGAEDLAVLSAHVTAAGPLGSKTLPAREGEDVHFRAHFGGLTGRKSGADVHLRWQPGLDFGFGDKIEIEFIQTDSADAPNESTPAKRKEPKSERQRK